jgi:PhnB protein
MNIQPYLFFEGRCQEALDFYTKALEAKVEMVMRFKEKPEMMEDCGLSPEMGEKVMHSAFKVGGATLLAADGMMKEQMVFKGFSLTLYVKDEAEAKQRFGALADGGEVTMPLAPTFYSPCFGMLKDKFGVHWMVIVPGEK